ncbi:MAG: hypothetical protein ABSH12_03980 [Endomicrobiales bacterium]
MYSVMRYLYVETGNPRYKVSADAAEDFLFKKAVIDGTTDPLILQSYNYQNGQWVQGPADAFDTNAWFILATGAGTNDFTNFQTMDSLYGKAFAFRLMMHALKKFGIFNSAGQLIGIGFSPQSTQQRVGSFEWGRFGLDALIATARYEASQGRISNANKLMKYILSLSRSLDRQRLPNSPLSPYSTSDNGQQVTSPDQWGWNIIPYTFSSDSASGWDMLSALFERFGISPFGIGLPGVPIIIKTGGASPTTPAATPSAHQSAQPQTYNAQYSSDNATWKTASFMFPAGLTVKKGQTLAITFDVSPGMKNIGYNFLRQIDSNSARSNTYSNTVKVKNGKVTFTITPVQDVTFVQGDIAVGLGFFGANLKNPSDNGFVVPGTFSVNISPTRGSATLPQNTGLLFRGLLLGQNFDKIAHIVAVKEQWASYNPLFFMHHGKGNRRAAATVTMVRWAFIIGAVAGDLWVPGINTVFALAIGMMSFFMGYAVHRWLDTGTIPGYTSNVIAHLSLFDDFMKTIGKYSNTSDIMHLFIVNKPQTMPKDLQGIELKSLEISPYIKVGKGENVRVTYGMYHDSLVFFVDVNDSGLSKESLKQATEQAALQILSSLYGTDALGANPLDADHVVTTLKSMGVDRLRNNFKLAMVVDHLLDDTIKTKEDISAVGIRSAQVVSENELDAKGMAINATINDMLIKNDALFYASSRNKIIQFDAQNIQSMEDAVHMVSAMENQQVLFDWQEIAKQFKSEQSIAALITEMKKGNVTSLLKYTATPQDTIKTIHDRLALGFTGIDLDLRNLTVDQTNTLLSKIENDAIPVIAVSLPGGYNFLIKYPRHIVYTLGNPLPQINAHDAVEILIPEGFNQEQVKQWLTMLNLPMTSTMIFHSSQLVRLAGKQRAIIDKALVVSFLRMMNIGNQSIQTIEDARALAYGWPNRNLPLLMSRDPQVRTQQINALQEGRLEGTNIPISSAMYDEVIELDQHKLQQAFLSVIAEKMIIREFLSAPDTMIRALEDNDIKILLEMYDKNRLSYRDQHLLFLAIMKWRSLQGDLRHQEVSNAGDVQEAMKNVTSDMMKQIVLDLISKDIAVSGTHAFAIGFLIDELLADSRLGSSPIEKQPGTLNIGAIEDLIAAA